MAPRLRSVVTQVVIASAILLAALAFWRGRGSSPDVSTSASSTDSVRVRDDHPTLARDVEQSSSPIGDEASATLDPGAIYALRAYSSRDEVTRVATAIANAMSQFEFVNVEHIPTGPVERHVAVFRHTKLRQQFVLIPSGLTRRLPEDRDAPGVAPFLMSRTECTVADWNAFSGAVDAGGDEADPVSGDVTWEEVQDWCDGRHVRLPTEREWEHAMQLGWRSWIEAADAADLLARGWFPWNGRVLRARPVGTAPMDRIGLYDVLGNVWELCSTEFNGTPPRFALIPNSGGSGASDMRVARGGGVLAPMLSEQGDRMYAIRMGVRQGTPMTNVGFRLACSIPGIGDSDSR